MGVGKSNAKMYGMEKATGVTFKDVAGQDEAKEALSEIVDFLHNPGKYTEIGAVMPKGALLVGLNQKRDDRLDLLRLYMEHEFDIREPVGFEQLVTTTDDVPTLKNIKKLNAWGSKLLGLDDPKIGAFALLNSCPTMDLLAYAYIAQDKPLVDWLIQQGLIPKAQYPCNWVSTKWTMSAKELRVLLDQ